MTKKKDVVQKFKTFFTNLNVEDRKRLYDILAAVRGPDTYDVNDIKYRTTGRIRYLLGLTRGTIINNGVDGFITDFCPGSNSEPFEKMEKLLQLLDEFVSNHYREHVIAALKHLQTLGYIEK